MNQNALGLPCLTNVEMRSLLLAAALHAEEWMNPYAQPGSEGRQTNSRGGQ